MLFIIFPLISSILYKYTSTVLICTCKAVLKKTYTLKIVNFSFQKKPTITRIIEVIIFPRKGTHFGRNILALFQRGRTCFETECCCTSVSQWKQATYTNISFLFLSTMRGMEKHIGASRETSNNGKKYTSFPSSVTTVHPWGFSCFPI